MDERVKQTMSHEQGTYGRIRKAKEFAVLVHVTNDDIVLLTRMAYRLLFISSFTKRTVMADLRLLEQMQEESVRKLAAAQQLKKRRQEALTHTQSRLEEMKYRNGQLKASIKRSDETLAINQRRLLALKERGRERRDELMLLDEEVTMNIDALQNLIIGGRRYEAHVNMYAKKVEILAHMVEESRKEVDGLQDELRTIQAGQDALRQSIRQHEALQQTLARESNDLRQQIVQAEQNVTAVVNERNSLLGQLDDLVKMTRDETVHHDKEAGALREEIHELKDTAGSLNEEKEALREAIDQATKKTHAAWTEIVDIQKAEGHDPSFLPSETSKPPVIDLILIENSLKKERSAVEDEQRAEEELRNAVDAMRVRLNELLLQTAVTTKEMEAALSVKADELVKAEAQKTAKLKMIEEIRKVEKNIKDIESATAPLQEMAEADRLARKEELERIAADAERPRALLGDELAEHEKLQAQMAKKSENDERAKGALLSDVTKERERSKDIDETIEDLEQLSKHGFGVDEITKRRKDAVTANEEIDRCLKSASSFEAWYPWLTFLCIRRVPATG
jgi:chromosome segregation ATPase